MSLGFIAVSFLMILCFLGYLFLMVFFPEWVGITGKVARRNQREHRGEESGSGPANLVS